MSIGMGLGVAGGSSDIERPIADALTQSVRSGKDRYVIPTAFGMSASDRPVTTGSGYIKVTPQGEVSDWRRASSAEQPRQRAVMSDHTVRAILDAHLSKTQTYVKPTPKAKKDPDVQPRSVVARLVKDIQGTPALNSQKYWERAIEVADKSGHPDLIPQEWRRAVAKRSRGHEVFALRTRLLCERAGIDL
jgi:hypothetical protein